jgi:hypothetical protein
MPDNPDNARVPHSPDICYWRQEKTYVLAALQDIQNRMGRFESKFEDFIGKVAVVSVQGDELLELKKTVGLSREEIAVLKVKASLLGVASAAALELVFSLLRYFKT